MPNLAELYVRGRYDGHEIKEGLKETEADLKAFAKNVGTSVKSEAETAAQSMAEAMERAAVDGAKAQEKAADRGKDAQTEAAKAAEKAHREAASAVEKSAKEAERAQERASQEAARAAKEAGREIERAAEKARRAEEKASQEAANAAKEAAREIERAAVEAGRAREKAAREASDAEKRAADEAERSARRAKKAHEDAARAFDEYRSRRADMMQGVGQAATIGVTVPVVAGAIRGGKLAGDLEQTLDVLQNAGKLADDELEKVARKARELGADLKLPATSANDAATAMNELVKAGFTLNDTLAASRGSLELAAAAHIDAATAAKIQAAALGAFRLPGTEAGRVADLLAGAANAAQGEITQMSDALKQSATVFAQAGIPIEDLVTMITRMAKAGILGSDAGTSLKTMLMALQNPTAGATKWLENMGIAIYDAQGKMVPFREIVGQFEPALKRMTQQQRDVALATIFGSDAMRAASVVLGDGVKSYDELNKAVSRQGQASEMSAARTKGLNGALDGLQSSLDTLLESLANPAIRPAADFIRWLSDAVTWAGRLPTPIKNVGLAIAGVAAVAGPAVLMSGRLAQALLSIEALSASYVAAGGRIGAANVGIGTTAATATGQLGGLRGTLMALMAGKWVIPVTVAVAAGALLKATIGDDFTNQAAAAQEKDRKAFNEDQFKRQWAAKEVFQKYGIDYARKIAGTPAAGFNVAELEAAWKGAQKADNGGVHIYGPAPKADPAAEFEARLKKILGDAAKSKTPEKGRGKSGGGGGRKSTAWRELEEFAESKGFTVTSTTGGKHNVGSPHYDGRAVDVRTRDKSPQEVAAFIDMARAAGIRVVDERVRPKGQKVWSGPHLHLEAAKNNRFSSKLEKAGEVSQSEAKAGFQSFMYQGGLSLLTGISGLTPEFMKRQAEAFKESEAQAKRYQDAMRDAAQEVAAANDPRAKYAEALGIELRELKALEPAEQKRAIIRARELIDIRERNKEVERGKGVWRTLGEAIGDFDRERNRQYADIIRQMDIERRLAEATTEQQRIQIELELERYDIFTKGQKERIAAMRIDAAVRAQEAARAEREKTELQPWLDAGMPDLSGLESEMGRKRDEAAKAIEDRTRESAERMADVFLDAFDKMRKGGKSAYDALRESWADTLQQMLLDWARSQLTSVFARALTAPGRNRQGGTNIVAGESNGVPDGALKDKGPDWAAILGTVISFIPRFASGGVSVPAPFGQPIMVGERGRELITLGQTSRIYSADETKRMMGGGGTRITLVQNIKTLDVTGFRRDQDRITSKGVASAARRAKRDGIR